MQPAALVWAASAGAAAALTMFGAYGVRGLLTLLGVLVLTAIMFGWAESGIGDWRGR